jgi:hypothetical protein
LLLMSPVLPGGRKGLAAICGAAGRTQMHATAVCRRQMPAIRSATGGMDGKRPRAHKDACKPQCRVLRWLDAQTMAAAFGAQLRDQVPASWPMPQP